MIDFAKDIIKFILFNFKALMKLMFSRRIITFPKNAVLFITHNLGGGTAFYEKNIDTTNFVFLRAICHKCDFCYELSVGTEKTYITNKKIPEIIGQFNKIIVNSLAKFSHKIEILELLSNTHEKIITYMVHDFDCICKNNFNLINGDFYCGLSCPNCHLYEKNGVKNYRESWKRFFIKVNEIRVFSESSAEIIKKIYPESSDVVKIVPHDITYLNNYLPIEVQTKELHIGIVGNCNGKAKGEFVVHNFLKFAAKNDVKVSVIGKTKLKNKVYSKNIVYRGRYIQSDLGKILQQEGINVVFLN